MVEAEPLVPLTEHSTPSERLQRYIDILERLKLMLEGMPTALATTPFASPPCPHCAFQPLLCADEPNFIAAMATVACEIHQCLSYSHWTVSHDRTLVAYTAQLPPSHIRRPSSTTHLSYCSSALSSIFSGILLHRSQQAGRARYWPIPRQPGVPENPFLQRCVRCCSQDPEHPTSTKCARVSRPYRMCVVDAV